MKSKNHGGYKKVYIGALFAAVLAFAAALSACGAYKAVYPLNDCSVSFGGRNDAAAVAYDKVYGGENFTVYFENDVDAQTADGCVANLYSAVGRLRDLGITDAVTCYVGDGRVSDGWMAEEGIVLTFSPGLSDEQILANLLYAGGGQKDVPFGIYAWLSAYMLNDGTYRLLPDSAVIGAGHLTDMQFPLYENGGLSQEESAFAWNFSYTVASRIIENGDPSNLLNATAEEVSDFLLGNYGLSLPSYNFLPYNSQYEYKVTQGVFTYYIDRQFSDLILPAEVFSTDYLVLCDWLDDNALSAALSDGQFGITEMYEIDVFLTDADGKNVEGEIVAYNGVNAIYLYSAGAFSREYFAHILASKGYTGDISYYLWMLRENDSRYANLMHYYLADGRAANYVYAAQTFSGSSEKELYGATTALYNKIAPSPASPGNFNYWLYADCAAALTYSADDGEMFVICLASFYNYVAHFYGMENVTKLAVRPDITEGLSPYIGEKYLSDVRAEWADYVHEILKAN